MAPQLCLSGAFAGRSIWISRPVSTFSVGLSVRMETPLLPVV
jgi:hypothetical protein